MSHSSQRVKHLHSYAFQFRPTGDTPYEGAYAPNGRRVRRAAWLKPRVRQRAGVPGGSAHTRKAQGSRNQSNCCSETSELDRQQVHQRLHDANGRRSGYARPPRRHPKRSKRLLATHLGVRNKGMPSRGMKRRNDREEFNPYDHVWSHHVAHPNPNSTGWIKFIEKLDQLFRSWLEEASKCQKRPLRERVAQWLREIQSGNRHEAMPTASDCPGSNTTEKGKGVNFQTKDINFLTPEDSPVPRCPARHRRDQEKEGQQLPSRAEPRGLGVRHYVGPCSHHSDPPKGNRKHEAHRAQTRVPRRPHYESAAQWGYSHTLCRRSAL